MTGSGTGSKATNGSREDRCVSVTEGDGVLETGEAMHIQSNRMAAKCHGQRIRLDANARAAVSPMTEAHAEEYSPACTSTKK